MLLRGMSEDGSNKLSEFLPRLTLVLGGAASGKSRYAESLINRSNLSKIYIATAQAFDDEMKEKIQAHQNDRGADWHTIEAPLDVSGALEFGTPKHAILIDCATLWLTNLILKDAWSDAESGAFLAALSRCKCPVIVVSNEVGQGVVPDNALSRKFRNAQGRLNQELASQADTVVAVLAGMPLALKGRLV